jgi:hypothetical protein
VLRKKSSKGRKWQKCVPCRKSRISKKKLKKRLPRQIMPEMSNFVRRKRRQDKRLRRRTVT